MEGDRTLSSDPTKASKSEKVKLIEWEGYEQEVAKLWSLSSALKESEEKKLSLQQKLNSFIQVEAELLSQSNELEEMHQRLETKNWQRKAFRFVLRLQQRMLKRKRGGLAWKSDICLASKKLQESKRSLSGERVCGRFRYLQKKLRMRQRCMISQVSLLYTVKISAGPSEEQELESFRSTSKFGDMIVMNA